MKAIIYFLSILFICNSATSLAAPFEGRADKKGKDKQERIKLTPEEKEQYDQFEGAVAECVSRRTQGIEASCMKRYPQESKQKQDAGVGKDASKNSNMGAETGVQPKKGKDKKKKNEKMSKDAKNCVTFFENAAALQCVDRLSKRGSDRVFGFWMQRNGKQVEKIKKFQKDHPEFGGSTFANWLKEFD